MTGYLFIPVPHERSLGRTNVPRVFRTGVVQILFTIDNMANGQLTMHEQHIKLLPT